MIQFVSPGTPPADPWREAAPEPGASPFVGQMQAVPVAADAPPTPPRSRPWRAAALIFCYSALLALGTFALDGRYGLNLADEGFVRYGVRAIVQAGQVPIRDFQSYDPGRYYWAAGWSLLLGDGIVTTRLAGSLFQIISVGVALLVLRRAGAGWRVLGTVGLLVNFWMLERFKLYEQCISLLALYPAVRLIQRPDRRNALLAGVFVGFAAFMGRNHGFYNFVAFGALLALLAWKNRQPGLLKLAVPWAGGIVLGYLPMLLMLAFVPGFWAGFSDSLHLMAKAKATNLTLPVPWPWRLKAPAGTPAFFACCAQAFGWCFVLLAAGFALGAVVIARLPGRRWRGHAWLVAAVVVGVPYAHYAFSRADAPHLTHSMPLLVVALLGLPGLLPRVPDRQRAFAAAAGGLALLSLLGTIIYNPALNRFVAEREKRYEVAVGEQTLNLDRRMALFVARLRRFAGASMAADENILIAPYAPTLYEVVGRFSPVPEIYFLWPQSPRTEGEMIRALERQRVNWALVGTEGLDGVPERSLPYSHPLLVAYLKSHFAPAQNAPVLLPYVLLRRTDPLPPATP